MGHAKFMGSSKHASKYEEKEAVGYESLEFRQRAQLEIYIWETLL